MTKRIALLIGVCLLISGWEAARAASYSITTIPTNGGATSAGWSINERGQVTGHDVDQQFGTAFLFDGSLHDIGSLGGPSSWGRAVNDNGWIAGFSDTTFDPITGSATHAFLYDGTTMHDIGYLGDGRGLSYALGINNSGVVVGHSAVPGPVLGQAYYHAYYYDGSMHDIHPGGQGEQSFAQDINSNGHIVGHMFTASGVVGYFYDGTVHELGTLGGRNAFAVGINDADHIAGYSENSSGQTQGFFHDGTMHELTGMKYAFDINEHDQIVGISNANFQDQASIWDPVNGVVNLNSLIDPGSPWVLNAAYGINDLGQITGYGTIEGQRRGFILTPVPEPSSVALAAVSLGFIVVCQARRRARLRRRS